MVQPLSDHCIRMLPLRKDSLVSPLIMRQHAFTISRHLRPCQWCNLMLFMTSLRGTPDPQTFLYPYLRAFMPVAQNIIIQGTHTSGSQSALFLSGALRPTSRP